MHSKKAISELTTTDLALPDDLLASAAPKSDVIEDSKSLFSEYPGLKTLGMGLGLGGAAYLASREAKKRGYGINPTIAAALAGLSPLALEALTNSGVGYNINRWGLGGAFKPRSELLSTPNREGYIRKYWRSLKGGRLPKGYKIPEDLKHSELIPINTFQNLARTKPVEAWDESVADMELRLKGLLKKDSNYIPEFNTNETIDSIINDPFLTPAQKNNTIRMLHSSAAASGNPLRGMLSTGDVVRGAIGAGLGGMVAKYMGTVVGGVFGGLSPNTLNKVQNTGALAGMLRGSGVWQ